MSPKPGCYVGKGAESLFMITSNKVRANFLEIELKTYVAVVILNGGNDFLRRLGRKNVGDDDPRTR